MSTRSVRLRADSSRLPVVRLRADANVPGVEPKADQTASLSPGGPFGTSGHASPGPRLGYDFSRVGVSSRTVADSRAGDGLLRPKLAVSRPHDEYELNADRVAEQVMRMPQPEVQRACACGGSCACGQEKRPDDGPERLQLKAAPGSEPGVAEAPPIVSEVLRSPGRPLAAPARAFMEPRFGHDFSQVRVHTDARAAESARQVNSLAYTVGNRIVFGAGSHAPGTEGGHRLLAHELTHVVQQGLAGGRPDVIRRAPGKGNTGDEPPRPVKPPKRVPYGSTALSKEAIRIRRANPKISGDQNLVIVKFSWRPTDGSGPTREVIEPIWNTSKVAHSEQELDQYFRDFKASRGNKVEITVHGIFSERQFCGPSGQDCQGLIYRSYPDAEKEFTYNYQTPPGIPRDEGPTTKNVVKQRIETFRDSGKEVDDSTRRDPPPYDERSGGRVPGQVVPPPKKPAEGGATAAKPAQAPPAAGTTAAPEAPAPAKPAPATPTAETPTTETHAKPAPPKPAPATPAAQAPAKPAPATPAETPTTETHAPAKPAPRKAPASKPQASRPSAAKPSAAKPPAAKPTSSPPSVDLFGPGTGGGGTAVKVLTESAASGATGVLLAKAMGELRKVVQQNPGDKDLATAVDTMDKVLDAKSFVDSPVNFAAGKIKEKLIQGVFDHFSASLNTAYQSFNEKFPSVATLHKDPLGTGVSLESYQQNYEKALAALRIPDARKTLLYAAALIGLDPDTQGEEIERRIGLVNQALAGLPGLSEYIKAYSYARDQYNFALGAVTNQLGLLDDEWAKQPAGLADGLRRRADALYGVAKVLEDAHDQLWNSGLVIWVPVLGAAQDLETLAGGFGGLAKPLSDFANVVGSRKGQYDKEFDRLHAEGIKVGAQAVRPF